MENLNLPGRFATQSFTITIREVNQPPILDPIPDRAVLPNQSIDFNAQATDPDRPMNKLRYRLESMMPSNATLDPTSGRFRWTPTQSGEYSFTIFVDDDGLPSLGDQQTFTVSVGEVFSPPDLPQLEAQTIAELQTLEYPVAAVASRPAQAIRYRLRNAPSGMSIDAATGLVRWRPTEAQAPNLYTITVEAFDADRPNLIARTNWQVTTLEVNSPPILTQPASITLDEETLATMQWIAKDNDLPANTLRFEAVDSLPVGASLSPDGLFRWMPPSRWQEAHSVFRCG